MSCLLFGGTTQNVLADEKEGSMDEVWSDTHSTSGSTTAATTINATTSLPGNFSLKQLKSSDFVNLGSWPDLGPFEDTDNKDILKDKFDNKLTLSANEDTISSAQLELSKNQGKFEDKMRLQVALDFLLESLGAKSGDIATINHSIERDFEKIAQSTTEPVNVSAGPYLVALSKGASDQNAAFSLTVTKAPDIVPATTTSTTDTSSTPATDNSATATTTASTNTNTINGDNQIIRRPKNTNTLKPADSKFSISTAPPTASGSNTNTGAQRTPPPSKTKDEVLRTQFENLVVGWQNIRRAVVKNRQTQNLTKILGGKALSVQSAAINSLLQHDIYFEFEPRSLKMTGFRQIVPDQKYEVDISIQERQKKFSAKTMKLLTDVEKDYRATYIVEKIRGAWLIIDFVLHN